MPNKIAPLICPHCKSQAVIEVIANLTLHHIFDWNARQSGYELAFIKDKSMGDTYLMCNNGHRFDEAQAEAFQRLVLKGKRG